MKEFQRRIMEIYYKKDRERGVSRTFQWLVEELGELARALRQGEQDHLEEEFADVLAWLASLANLMDVSLFDVGFKRYGKGCPKCHSIPCTCVEPPWRMSDDES